MLVKYVVEYCSSVIIDESQFLSAHNILNTTKCKQQKPINSQKWVKIVVVDKS